jgi:hypothetical protein
LHLRGISAFSNRHLSRRWREMRVHPPLLAARSGSLGLGSRAATVFPGDRPPVCRHLRKGRARAGVRRPPPRPMPATAGSIAAERPDDRGPNVSRYPLSGRRSRREMHRGSPVSEKSKARPLRCSPLCRKKWTPSLWPSRKKISAWREVSPRSPVKTAFLGVPLLLATGTHLYAGGRCVCIRRYSVGLGVPRTY